MYRYYYGYYVGGKLEEEDCSDPCQNKKAAGRFLAEEVKRQYDEWLAQVGKEKLSLRPISFGSDIFILKNLVTKEEYKYWIEECP